VHFDELNVQLQPALDWPASFEVVRARYVQALRTDTMSNGTATAVGRLIDNAERLADGPGKRAAAALLEAAAGKLDRSVERQALLADALVDLADTLR